MDFHQLLAKLNQIDSRSTDQINNECGMPPAAPVSPPVSTTPPPPPPSMSVNLNAQGLDNIEQMMKLFQKVNPDMMPKAPIPMPVMSPPSALIGKPSETPLRMLPDFDADNDDKVGGEMDIEIEPMPKSKGSMMTMGLDKDDEGSQPGGLGASLDRDGDGDHDMDDHELEPKDDNKDKKEAWANEPNEEEKDVDYMVNKLAGGMNRSQKTYPKVAGGDNPMQRITSMEGDQLRAQIRADLQRRLAEAKGAK